MGCHTWFYKKENRSIEEARALFIKDYQAVIQEIKNTWNDPDGHTQHYKKTYNLTEEQCLFQLHILERQLRMVEKGLCNVAVMNKQEEICDYISDKGFFIEVDGFHDLFRIGKYPLNKLFSLEDTMNFIKEKGEEIYSKADNYEENLKEFWTKYPDGMIKFG